MALAETLDTGSSAEVESSDASIIQGTTHYEEKDKHDPSEAFSSFPRFSYIKALIYEMTA